MRLVSADICMSSCLLPDSSDLLITVTLLRLCIIKVLEAQKQTKENCCAGMPHAMYHANSCLPWPRLRQVPGKGTDSHSLKSMSVNVHMCRQTQKLAFRLPGNAVHLVTVMHMGCTKGEMDVALSSQIFSLLTIYGVSNILKSLKNGMQLKCCSVNDSSKGQFIVMLYNTKLKHNSEGITLQQKTKYVTGLRRRSASPDHHPLLSAAIQCCGYLQQQH